MLDENKYTEICRGYGHDDTTYIMWEENGSGKRVITNDLGDILDNDVTCSFGRWIHDWTR